MLNLALDKEALVRCEAYDSLSEFIFKDVEEFLKKSIIREKDELACSYAIMSWSEVIVNMYSEFSDYILFIDNVKEIDMVKNNENCMLNCAYARYLFNGESELNEILKFIKSEDYHIRCATINTLYDVIDDNNKKEILRVLKKVLETEKVVAVKESLREFLKMYICDFKEM